MGGASAVGVGNAALPRSNVSQLRACWLDVEAIQIYFLFLTPELYGLEFRGHQMSWKGDPSKDLTRNQHVPAQFPTSGLNSTSCIQDR